ncbi:hypothetical protein ACRAWG_12160 [Methylobacterium sp. P31]
MLLRTKFVQVPKTPKEPVTHAPTEAEALELQRLASASAGPVSLSKFRAVGMPRALEAAKAVLARGDHATCVLGRQLVRTQALISAPTRFDAAIGAGSGGVVNGSLTGR